MPKKAYEEPQWLHKTMYEGREIPKSYQPKMALILQAVDILEEYTGQGYQLTLRQLYYQFVSRDIIPNVTSEYDKLGRAITDGRMWGLIDWDHIVDRGRNYIEKSHWDDPGDVIRSAANSFGLDRWADSATHIEVWVEKQALEEVVGRACKPWDVGYLACKGYMSVSEMWSAAQRVKAKVAAGKHAVVIHLGDHDPSGIDMSRDIGARYLGFGQGVEIRRIALNMDQVDEYKPPPNPAKTTDARFRSYKRKYGDESWELDALEPQLLDKMIQDEIQLYVDDAYREREYMENVMREQLDEAAEKWPDIVNYLEKRER